MTPSCLRWFVFPACALTATASPAVLTKSAVAMSPSISLSAAVRHPDPERAVAADVPLGTIAEVGVAQVLGNAPWRWQLAVALPQANAHLSEASQLRVQCEQRTAEESRLPGNG